MQKLIETARKLNNERLAEAARDLSRKPLTTESRMVRAALVEVYAERLGAEAADKLMDDCGM